MNSLRIFNLILCLSVLSACAQSKFEAQSTEAEVLSIPDHTPSTNSQRKTSQRSIEIKDVFEDEEAPEQIEPQTSKNDEVKDEKIGFYWCCFCCLYVFFGNVAWESCS